MNKPTKPIQPARQPPCGTRAALAAFGRKPLFWCGLAALLLVGYGYAMATSAVGIDDLAIDTYQQGGEFLRQSRITEWLVQALTGLLAYGHVWPECWAAVCLALAGVGLAAVLFALAGREILAALLRLALGITGESGAAARTIYWGQRGGIASALLIFVREFLGNYGTLALAVPAIALLDLACAALVVFVAVRRHGNGCGWLAVGLLASQFAMGILQGTGSQMARASQCFAVFVPFVAWLALAVLRPRRWAEAACIAALLGVEALSLNQTFGADRARWAYEKDLLQDVAAQLDALDPTGEEPVVFTGEITLPDAVTHRLPAGHPAYKAAWVLSVALGAPMGDLYPYEEVNESVVNWAQSAFGSHEQIYLLMEEIGRPCAVPTDDQQAAGDALAGEAQAVTRQDGYLLVCFGS